MTETTDDLAEYDEARRDLSRLHERLRTMGETMNDFARDLRGGDPLDGRFQGRFQGRSRSLSDRCTDLTEFESTVTQYRETRDRAEAAYNNLINAGRESILDLSKFPNY